MYTYPQYQDNPEVYYALVGSFWNEIYGGFELVLDYLQGIQLNQAQLFNDLQELQGTVGLATCPVFHTQNWYRIQFFKSQLVNGGHPIDPSVADLEYGANALMEPSVVFVRGLNFSLDDNIFSTTINLFNDQRITPIPVFDVHGNIIDYEVDLYFFKAQQDWEFLYTLFGYAVDLQLPSSANYKLLLQAMFSSYTGATSYIDIAKALSAMTDAQIALSDGEIVEIITSDANYLLIITDQNVYRYNLEALPVVSVGVVLTQGDPLVDAARIFQPTNGAIPDYITQIVVPAKMLDASISQPLVFFNTQEALEATPNVGGYTMVSWNMPSSNPTAVSTFFDLLHSKGIAAGKTLAMCLDLRPQPQATQPLGPSLPTTINPALFVCQNVIRANAFILTLNFHSYGSDAIDFLPNVLRNMIPAATTYIMVSSTDWPVALADNVGDTDTNNRLANAFRAIADDMAGSDNVQAT